MRKRNLNLNSKKGNAIFDTIFFLIAIFVFAMAIVVGYSMFTELNDDIQADAEINTVAKTNLDSLHDKYPSTMDAAFVLALVLLWVAVIVASFLIDTHPVFFIFTVILMALMLFASSELSNFYQDFISQSEYTGFEQAFPMMSFIINHLVMFVLGVGASAMLVLFGKQRS